MTALLLRLAGQWIAGERAEDGVRRVKEANSRGILGILNLLGEHIESKDQIENTIKEYTKLLELIDDSGVKSQISIKPTQMGLNLDEDYCTQNFLKMAEACKSHSDNYLWIDMENSPYTEKTLVLYNKVLAAYPNTGVALQAYLRNSESNLRDLLQVDSKVRLVKGAYNESPEIAFKKKDEIRSNYQKLLELFFSRGTKDNFLAVATHDSKLVEISKSLSKKYIQVPFEYEMLMGVRDNLKTELVSEGLQVREYVPYGPAWLPYSIRRLREKKSNILLLFRSIFGG